MKLILAVLITLAAYPAWANSVMQPIEVADVRWVRAANGSGCVQITLRSLTDLPVGIPYREVDKSALHIANHPPLFDARDATFSPYRPEFYDDVFRISSPPRVEIQFQSFAGESLAVLGELGWLTGAVPFIQKAAYDSSLVCTKG